MTRRRTWLFVLAGIALAGVLLVVVLVGAGAWFFSRHVQVRDAPPTAAAAEFDAIRQRFAGKPPLIDVSADGRAAVAELERRRASYSGPLPESFKLIVWDKREQRMARLSFPFWLLQFQGGQSPQIDVNGVDLDRLGITAEDLRLAGPALVLDREDASTHVIVWTE